MFKKNKTNNLQFPFSKMVSGNEETKCVVFQSRLLEGKSLMRL